MRQVWPLSAKDYVPHAVHRADRAWPESNCYVDLWIELLHAAGCEPLAALPFTLTIDLEGDQWTFFKFPLADLYDLYGIDVFELNVWRALPDHVDDQLSQGRPLIVEVDAFHLPDTAGVSYRLAHGKTSIGIQMLDAGRRRLGYFHNAGYFELEGDDFDGVLRLAPPLMSPEHMPPYIEVARLGMHRACAGRALVARSLEALRRQLGRRPAENPFRRYQAAFASHLEWLSGGTLDTFHRYAFATLRQCGSAFELAAAYLEWLEGNGEGDVRRIAASCETIATTAKTLQFKTARVVQASRPFDPAPLIASMAEAWDQVMQGLTALYGGGADPAAERARRGPSESLTTFGR
jgi:hypothetical protein